MAKAFMLYPASMKTINHKKLPTFYLYKLHQPASTKVFCWKDHSFLKRERNLEKKTKIRNSSDFLCTVARTQTLPMQNYTSSPAVTLGPIQGFYHRRNTVIPKISSFVTIFKFQLDSDNAH